MLKNRIKTIEHSFQERDLLKHYIMVIYYIVGESKINRDKKECQVDSCAYYIYFSNNLKLFQISIDVRVSQTYHDSCDAYKNYFYNFKNFLIEG